MSFNQQTIESCYANKDGKMTAYGLGKISTSGKFALAKLGKASENGISITLCSIASSGMVSGLSSSAKEKGVKAIEIYVGDVVLFDVNAQSKKADFKTKVEGDSPEKKVIETLIAALDYHKIQSGEIFMVQANFMAIPLTGWPKKVLTGWMKDDEIIDDEGNSHPLLIKKLANKADFDAIIEEQGYDVTAWDKAYEAISSAVITERQQYQKKDFGASLLERIAAIESITPETKERILKLCGADKCDEENKQAVMDSLCDSWLKSV